MCRMYANTNIAHSRHCSEANTTQPTPLLSHCSIYRSIGGLPTENATYTLQRLHAEIRNPQSAKTQNPIHPTGIPTNQHHSDCRRASIHTHKCSLMTNIFNFVNANIGCPYCLPTPAPYPKKHATTHQNGYTHRSFPIVSVFPYTIHLCGVLACLVCLDKTSRTASPEGNCDSPPLKTRKSSRACGTFTPRSQARAYFVYSQILLLSYAVYVRYDVGGSRVVCVSVCVCLPNPPRTGWWVCLPDHFFISTHQSYRHTEQQNVLHIYHAYKPFIHVHA